MSTSPHPLITSPNPPAVPAAGLARVTDKHGPQPVVLVEWTKSVTERFGLEDKDLDWRIYARYVTVEKFVQGEQFGRVSRLDGSWRVRPRKEGDPRYVHNWLRGHSRTILAQWTMSQGEFDVIALPDGDAPDENEGAARNGKAVLEHYQRTLLTEEFKQREGMLAQTTGQMLRYSYWDANAGSDVKRAQYEDEEIAGPSTFTCADCGMAGSEEGLNNAANIPGGNNDGMLAGGADSGGGYSNSGYDERDIQTRTTPQTAQAPSGVACPSCGSSNLAIEPGSATTLPRISGYDEGKTGDLVCLSIPGYQVKYDRLPVRLRDSQWLRWRSYVRPETIKELIPGWKKAVAAAEDDYGQRAEMVAKRSSGNMEAVGSRVYGQAGARSDAELVTVDRWWFRPSIYCDVTLKADVELADGTTIPAGTQASEAFPDGLYVMMVNNEPLDFRNEDFRDHWQHTPATLLPSRIDGDGLLDDLIEPQKEINDVKGLKLSNIKHVAGAGLMYRSEYLERQDISGKPYELVPIKPGADPNMKLQDMVAAIPRPSLSAEVYNYEEQMHEEMRWMAASYPSSTGEGDPNQQTSSGAHLLSQNAQSQRAPELALRAAGDIECAMQWLKLFQKNATDEMYIPFQGKVGELDGRWFKGADLPKTFVVSLRPRSYIPKSENDRRGDFAGFLQVFGGVEGLMMAMQAAPDLVREASERFNVSVDFGNINLAHQVARLRIEAMKALLPQVQAAVQAMGQPEMAIQALISAPDVAVDPDEPHEQFIEFYKKWKLEDEGLEARKQKPLLYEGVNALIASHKEAMVMQAQEQSAMQVAAQAPQMQAQQAMQAQQTEQQQQGEQAKAQADAQSQQQQMAMQDQQQAQQTALQEAQAEAQRQHEMQMAQMQAGNQAAEGDASHRRALELEREKQKGAVALAKARPKGSGK